MTSGGRVLGVTARSPSIALAVQRVYQAVEQIQWPGVHYRRDIGYRALQRSLCLSVCSVLELAVGLTAVLVLREQQTVGRWRVQEEVW